ncbi:MAG: ComF family protein [Chloroflexota bacterium]
MSADDSFSKRSWQNQYSNFKRALLDAILPPVCAYCNRVGELFCTDCLAAVKWVEHPICHKCGRVQRIPTERCSSCQKTPLPLDRIRAATLHVDPVRLVLHKMKYEGFFALSEPLGNLMIKAWPMWQHSFDLVLPIPLHPQRERERGYNQSELLVRQLRKELGWATEPAALKRYRRTRPQLGLTANERRANVRDAFGADSVRVNGKRILLVDDVCTTGSTLASAAEALLNAGARSISAYCLTQAIGNQTITNV